MKYLFYIVSLISITLLSGCVKEETVFNEDSVENITSSETSIIVTFLNEKYVTENENFITCFSLNYPITISYNTDQYITVMNEEGLVEVFESQSSNFHINGIVFPITITTDNNNVTIENTNDFITFFKTCDGNTLNNTLLDNLDACFDFQYPTTLFNDQESEVTINSNNNFVDYLTDQEDNYIVAFKFPFIINENVINNYFDIYQISNNCVYNLCPEISLEASTVDTNYTFQASGHDDTTTANYSWSINGEYIENGNFDGSNNQYFSYNFTENGTYTICAFIETLECPNGAEYCEEITINNFNLCPEISLETSTVDTNYTFQASGHDDTTIANYSWFINGDYIENGNFDGNNNEYFSYNFTENGTYTICAFIETPECPNGVEYCEEITITNINPCPEISLETSIVDTNYTFQASGHADTTTANYSWSINDEYIQIGNFDGNNNEYFSYNFTENGTYTICALIETLECPNGIEYCEEITITNINPNPCPEISFETSIIDTSYRFQAFGHDATTTANYSWSINGEYILIGNFDGNNNEYFSHSFTENGTYTICVFVETPECPNGVEYCEEIVIDL